MGRIVAYVCGPFRAASISVPGHQDMFKVQQNIMRAAELALSVTNAGIVAMCPHMNSAFFTGAAPDSVWLEDDLELLRRSDAVILTENWRDSSGAKAEVEEANRVGIPVFTSLAALVMWRDRKADGFDEHATSMNWMLR